MLMASKRSNSTNLFHTHIPDIMNIAEITLHLTDLKARCEAGAAKIVNAGNLEFFNGYALGVQHALEILIAYQSAEDIGFAIEKGQS